MLAPHASIPVLLNSMKIVIAPDSFKGSLEACVVARCIEEGVHRVLPQARCVLLPMADGGEGTASVMRSVLGGRWVHVPVLDPLARPVRARYALLKDGGAAIEMAAASGLAWLDKQERNPMRTTTYGTGQLLADALDRGVRYILLGIGGSATNDAGAGMLQALGACLLGASGRRLTAPASGGMLTRVRRLDITGLRRQLRRIRVACDVDNPLCGARGASRVYGPQKGATPGQARQLDAKLKHFGHVLEEGFCARVINKPGAGAAGGIGAALMAAGAKLEPGVALIARTVRLGPELRDADLLLTGEGCIDHQTPHGKVPAGVARIARRHGVPTIAIGGSLGEGAALVYSHGVAGVEASVTRPVSEADALARARRNLVDAAERAMRLVNTGRRMHR